jgi:hypothetical protein
MHGNRMPFAQDANARPAGNRFKPQRDNRAPYSGGAGNVGGNVAQPGLPRDDIGNRIAPSERPGGGKPRRNFKPRSP